jgi:hypothetical protein
LAESGLHSNIRIAYSAGELRWTPSAIVNGDEIESNELK